MITPEGFEEFVAARSARLLRTAYLLTHDWNQAEDLLQTALVRAWEAWRRIDADPEPYVRRIMFNAYASWWQRSWRGERPTAEFSEVSDGADPQVRLDDRDLLWRAMSRLPRRQRAVLVLRYFEDLSEVEVADVLGCSVGTVKSQASRAVAKLRLDETFTEEGVLR